MLVRDLKLIISSMEIYHQEQTIYPTINFIGPWKFKVVNWIVKFNTFTCIDMVEKLTELIQIKKKKEAKI